MTIVCSCSSPFGNTGRTTKKTDSSVDKMLILVPLVANDGTTNEIDLLNDTLDQAYFTAKFNHTDASKRWYPVPDIENIEDLRGDPTLQTLNSGINLIAQKGTRNFTGIALNREPEYLAELEKWDCSKFGAFVVNSCGDLKGSTAVADKLRPIAINESMWNPTLIKATDTERQAVMVSFEWKKSGKDSDIGMIYAADMGDALLLDSEGLLDIIAVETTPAPTTTEFTAKYTLKYGSETNLIAVEGLIDTDFSILNNTTGLAVAVLTATEISAGVYTLTFAAQSPADTLTPSVTKTGFDGSSTGLIVTIP